MKSVEALECNGEGEETCRNVKRKRPGGGKVWGKEREIKGEERSTK